MVLRAGSLCLWVQLDPLALACSWQCPGGASRSCFRRRRRCCLGVSCSYSRLLLRCSEFLVSFRLPVSR